jgi:hypothetical protein
MLSTGNVLTVTLTDVVDEHPLTLVPLIKYVPDALTADGLVNALEADESL